MPGATPGLPIAHALSGVHNIMIHTDVYYDRPVVYKLTTSLRDKYITLDSWFDPFNYEQTNKDVPNTYLRPVSFVSNDAAVSPVIGDDYE